MSGTMSDLIKILIIPTNGYGHLNIGLGLADMLTKHGHKPIFALNKRWAPAAEARGYETRILDADAVEPPEADQAARQMAVLEFLAPSLNQPTIEQVSWMSGKETMLYEDHKQIDAGLESLLAKESFHLLIVATLLALPTAETSGIPWVYFHTPSPHILYGTQITPPFSGYPLDTPKEICQVYWDRYFKERAQGDALYNEYLTSKGVGPINTGYFQRESPYLNVYAYPKELDYRDVATLSKHYFRMDNSIRENDGLVTVIPSEFLKRPGKLIYVSLGSWFSGVVQVMNNLINILSKSKHKFIVSKGPNHDKIKLPENMWGERFLNQLTILPMVDLVITHGGNNTIVECLHNGKPMIVLPFFIDQHDNAQRVVEKKLGHKFNPFALDEKSILESIETLLVDTDLYSRLTVIAEELKNSSTRDELVRLLEIVAREKRCPFDDKANDHDTLINQSELASETKNESQNGQEVKQEDKIETNGQIIVNGEECKSNIEENKVKVNQDDKVKSDDQQTIKESKDGQEKVNSVEKLEQSTDSKFNGTHSDSNHVLTNDDVNNVTNGHHEEPSKEKGGDKVTINGDKKYDSKDVAKSVTAKITDEPIATVNGQVKMESSCKSNDGNNPNGELTVDKQSTVSA